MAANPMKRKLGIILAFVFVAHLSAQSGIDSESLWLPSISQAEFQQCADALAFSDESDEAVFKVIYTKLLDDYRHHSTLTKQRLKEIKADRDAYRAANPDIPRLRRGLVLADHDALFAWQTLRKELDAQFDRDVRLSLTKKQQEIWINTIQSSRRRRMLPEVRQLGQIRSSSDLVAILDTIDLPLSDRDVINPNLSEYVVALDEALRHWERQAYVLQAKIMDIAYRSSGGEPIFRERQLILRQQIEALAATISDLNLQYMARIESQLSDQASQRFVESVYKIEYPDLFVPSPVDLVVSLVGETDQISEEQRAGIDATYEAYVIKRAEIRRHIIKGVYQWEHPHKRDLEKRQIAYKQYIVDGLDPYKAYEGHPAMKWLYKRRSLAKNTCTQVRGLFADDEFESLPLSLRLLLVW